MIVSYWTIISPSMFKLASWTRFLLLCSRFLRTTITLLDSQDQELIKPDSHYLVPPAPKQNRYLDHQLHSQHPGLPQLSSASSTPLQVTPALSASPPSPVSNVAGAHSQTLPLEPTKSQTGTNNTSTNGNIPTGSTSNGSSGWPRPNSAIAHDGVRPSPVSGSNRMNSTPLRTKQANKASLLQPGLSTTLANSISNRKGGVPANGYPSLKATLVHTALDRTTATLQDPQVQQPGRPSYQLSLPPKNGVNGNEHAAMNMTLGVGSLQLKMPVQRTISVWKSGQEETHNDTTRSETSPLNQTS